MHTVQHSTQEQHLKPLQERVIVTRTEGDYAWVTVMDNAGGCDSCASKGACGSFNLFKPLVDEKIAIKNNNNTLKVRNRLNASKGDEIIIEMSSQSLLKGTFLVYLLPLFMLFAGALIGQAISGELLSTVFGIMGLIIGLFFVKNMFSNTSLKETIEPKMVENDDIIKFHP